jgi:4-amino-4-deoxy-L-arabinose transferase-like glycosyltransferase
MFKRLFVNRKKEVILLTMAMLIAAFFNFYKSSEVPACLNSDEVAFGYNAYAILQTGRDEFGKLLPLRFQSFNDFKLPLYTYLSVPFVKVFGLNDFSTRLLNKVLGILLVPTVYITALALFKKKKIAMLSAYLTSLAPWIYIISRHAHEGVLLVFFLLWALYFTVRYQEDRKPLNLLISDIFLILASHSYHLGRFFVAVFLLYQIGIIVFHVGKKIKQNKSLLVQFVCISFVLLIGSVGIDAMYGAPRVNKLFLFQNEGFKLILDEKIREDGNFILHNYIASGITNITSRYFEQISPEFFVVSGDKNPRFGIDGISLITPLEYIFVFIGLFYLFKDKQKYRYLLTLLLLISPIVNALTWQDRSLIRTYFMIFPILMIASYGLYSMYTSGVKYKKLFAAATFFIYMFFLVQSWDMYLFHYYKRALTARSWQCGYKEVAQYVKDHYDDTKEFYITIKHGQPYIYLLFYNQIDPRVFQKSLELTKPDEYGFTQVRAFDKFKFYMFGPYNKPGVTYIGYPDDFDSTVDQTKVTHVKFRDEEMFWIADN